MEYDGETTIDPRSEEFNVKNGLVLMISNNFYNDSRLRRTGNEYDERSITALTKLLNFKGPLIIQDENDEDNRNHKPLTVEEVSNTLCSVANNDKGILDGVDCLLVFVLSHGGQKGDKEYIKFWDGDMFVSEIVQKFSNKLCKPLCGRPKMFFFESCCGEEKENPLILTRKLQCDGGRNQREVVTIADKTEMLIANASYDDHIAYLSNRGSIFIQCLESVFNEGIPIGKELHEMMIEVNRKVALKAFIKDNKVFKEVSRFKSSLTKKVFFNK